MQKIGDLVRALKRDSPFLIVVANFMAMALALATAPVVARAIGPEGRGESAATLAAFAIVPIFLAIGIPLEIRRLAAQGTADPAIRASRDLWFIAVIPATATAWALDFMVFQSLAPPARLLAFIGVVSAPLTMSWTCDVSVLIAQARYRAVMLLRLTQPVIFFVGAFSIWMLGNLSVTVILAINIVATAVTATLGASFVRVSLRGKRESHRSMIQNGFRYSGSSIAEAASNRLDQIIVLPLIGAGAAGMYSVAVTIGALPLALGHALGATYFRAVAAASRHEIDQLISTGIRAISSLAAVGCGILALASPLLISILFGPSFTDAIIPALITIVGSFALTVGYVCSMMLAAQGQGLRMTIAQVVALAVGIFLLLALTPSLGAIGASVASSCSYLVVLAILLLGLRANVFSLVPTPSGVRTAMRELFR